MGHFVMRLLCLLLVGLCLAGVAHAQPITSQIHNAPGWLPSHNYPDGTTSPHSRVNNGAGWTPGTTQYNPGLALKSYQLTSGSCTSASSGGPSGTASDITDGTCHWKYLSKTDYISFTGWQYDGPAWSAGTAKWGVYVTTNVGSPPKLRSYSLVGALTCNSTVAPSGVGVGGSFLTGQGRLTTSDGCIWDYLADVIYSSGASYMPTSDLSCVSTK